MAFSLVLSIRLHDGRFHGVPEWPPSPARLFQALVAGAAEGAGIAPDLVPALTWLESSAAPPVIAAPTSRQLSGFTTYVPNNDLDTVNGDPRRIGEIRTAKSICPRLFEADVPFHYVWDAGDSMPETLLTALVARLYQFGRGIDMAWAWVDRLDAEQLETLFNAYPGILYKPGRAAGTLLDCPAPGTLDSLIMRHAAFRRRLKIEKKATSFSQPPKGRFRTVAYNAPTQRTIYALRDPLDLSKPARWPLERASALVHAVRGDAEDDCFGIAARLRKALPDKAALIDRMIIGRGAVAADKDQRVRIIPLPSTGFSHTEQAIRRVMVERPPNCPIRVDDLNWGFSGLDVIDIHTGEPQATLVRLPDDNMAGHYGVGRSSRQWRTMTPCALPVRRRRIDPTQRLAQAKGGPERAAEEAQAVSAVRHALRHAGVRAEPTSIRVQREPFARKGARAELFAQGTRFDKHALWHVELAFDEPIAGPLLLGDGRYLGLGLYEAVRGDEAESGLALFALGADTSVPMVAAPEFLKAVRRALMALDRDGHDGGKPHPLFSGHAMDGAPLRSGRHEHVFLAAHGMSRDGDIDSLLVVAPWRADRAGTPPGTTTRERFSKTLATLASVRAGKLGIIALRGLPADDHPALQTARVWRAATAYRPTRRWRSDAMACAHVVQDLTNECARRGLPRPEVTFDNPARPRWPTLRFAVAVTGPLLLGLGAHLGEGMFVPA